MRKSSGGFRIRSLWLATAVACGGCAAPPIANHVADTDAGTSTACMTDAQAGNGSVSVASAVTKVKTLLVGLPPTEAEVNAVAADPNALQGLITQWMTLPQYTAKMLRFFVSSFQQDQFAYSNLVYDLDLYSPFQNYPAWIVQNAQESFARTVLELIAEGQPFTTAMTTQRYMMTPALMTIYALHDALDLDDYFTVTDLFRQNHPSQVTVESTRPIPIEEASDPTSPNFLTFYVPSLAGMDPPRPAGCPTGSQWVYPSPAPFQAIAEALFNARPWSDPTISPFVDCPLPLPGAFAAGNYILESDFTTWQMVTVRPPAPGEPTTQIYDLPSMRAGHDLVLNTPWVGFFTPPAFFARWSTNNSNQARVLLNQTLIVALGTPIDLTNASVPTDLSAIETTHAAPGTECYGCHVALDPMRQFFRHTYTLYGSSQQDSIQLGMLGQFAFHGVTATGTHGITDLGAQLAAHPMMPTAWVQRLCTYATSAPCLETDPEFVRLVNLFVSSNYSWNALVRALFASPLVTYLTPTLTTTLNGQVFPITRQEHLCALFSARLGVTDLCGLDVTTTTQSPVAQDIAPSWPSGQYGRGNPLPTLARQPSLLLRGGMENICADLARMFVTTDPASMFPVGNPTMAIQNIATQLMGLSGARLAGPEAILQQHYSSGIQGGASVTAALQSTFVLGCTSAYVAGMGQ